MAFRNSVLRMAREITVDGAAVGLEGFIRSGPLFKRCMGEAAVAPSSALDLERWCAQANLLTEKLLKVPEPTVLSTSEAIRVYQYYLPVYFWLTKQLDDHRAASAGTPLVVGMSCPQGGGKTAIADALRLLFSGEAMAAVDVSLDDFYLTRAEQAKLSSEVDVLLPPR